MSSADSARLLGKMEFLEGELCSLLQQVSSSGNSTASPSTHTSPGITGANYPGVTEEPLQPSNSVLRDSGNDVEDEEEEDLQFEDDEQYMVEDDAAYVQRILGAEVATGEGDAPDEWRDDDDPGYTLTPISEEDFLELEQTAARTSARMSDLEQSTFTWKSASSPEKDIDVDSSYILEAEDSPLSSPVPQSVEDDLLAAETILSDERLEEDDDDEELPPHPVHLKGSKRFSDVMGQSMYHGIDGEHSFFNLKVIFEPRKTGMQEARDFEGTPGTVVAGRYQVMDNMASGAFASAYQCVDAETADVQGNPSWVCLKVIKNNKEYFDQSLDEIKLLQYINSRGSPDEKHFLRLIDFFYYREHLFIVSELLRENLFDFDRDLRLSGAPTYYTLPRLKKISAQMLEALAFIHSLKLIHCDIKPENIVIKSYSRCEVKLIDFGSSCYDTDVKASYIQSRSYRAPEVVLGNDYDHRIDLWSLGGVLAELHTGYVLFQNDSLATMLARITGILGEFPPYVLLEGRETPSYYTASGTLFEMGPESEQPSYSLVHPKTTSLAARLHLAEVVRAGGRDEALFVDFLTQMLDLDWRRRPTASRALLHPWLEDAYHNDVYYEAV